jgi:sterol 3beta-glucosyltransferase
MQLTIVAVGSRGDVQPYLALALGLQKAGFQVQFCADRLFENLVTSTGLPFTPVTAAPADMMQQNLSRYGGPIKLISWLNQHFKPLARQFFSDLASVTTEADAILYSGLAFAGYHVAEKHGIPALGVYNIPITPTHHFQNPSFPSAPAWFPFKKFYNWWSFRIANQIFINLIKPIVNECRIEVLGIKPLANSFFWRLDIAPLPIVYGFSPNLLPPPDDWGNWRKVSGHWFLEDNGDWQPSTQLLRFLEAGSPPIYVGFGSMIDQQIKRATPIVIGALKRMGQRGILLGGWGGLGMGDLPDTILHVESVPHHWLFPRVSAIVHHGGAGTTATGLRYGKPSVVVPFFADQPFWGERVHALGCGPRPIPFSKLDINRLVSALDQAINERSISLNAQSLSEKLKTEDGVAKAIGFIRSFLENNTFSTVDKS